MREGSPRQGRAATTRRPPLALPPHPPVARVPAGNATATVLKTGFGACRQPGVKPVSGVRTARTLRAPSALPSRTDGYPVPQFRTDGYPVPQEG